MYANVSKALNVLKTLKYKLNRASLNSLYKSHVRPLMEYADVIWDGCSEGEANILETVQYEAARVVTGAMKGTNKRRLLNELCWEDMKTRRLAHKLILFYKITNSLTPSYLYDIMPLQVNQRIRSAYTLRSSDNYSLIPARTERFKKSFFPSTVAEWNVLDTDLRNTQSFFAFKAGIRTLCCGDKYNKIYDISLSRFGSILHTRLRLGQCQLNSYLYRINCKPSPFCDCTQNIIESITHYFLYCSQFAAQRGLLIASASRLFGANWYNFSDSQKIQIFLHGSELLDQDDSQTLMFDVQSYIINTKRFC